MAEKDMDDDVRYRNRFRDGGDDEPMKRKDKRVYDRSTGKFNKPASRLDGGKWIRGKAGTDGPGKGALAKSRKKAIDSQIKKSGG